MHASLFENIQSYYFFYTCDKYGIIKSVSNSVKNILGYSKNEFLNNYIDYFTDDSMKNLLQEHLDSIISGNNQEPFIVSMYHKNANIKYLEFFQVALFDNNNLIKSIDIIVRDVTIEHLAQKEITHLAKHDVLTGISNRLKLEEELQILISNSQRFNTQFAMLYFDLDHFKDINDTLGHDIGDILLKEVTKRLSQYIRKGDIFARIGGDEFIIVLTNIDKSNVMIMINKIMNLMREIWHINGYELNVSASMGIAMYPEDGQNSVSLMKNADIAMYKAKENGRDNFSFFTSDLNERVHEEMELERDMPQALKRGEFELYYQPKVKLSNDELIDSEALLRWNHPQKGLLYPNKFICIAENSGFITELGKFVIQEGCRFIAMVNKILDNRVFQLSLNISIRQLQLDDVYNVLKSAININGIDASQIYIEITEIIMVKSDLDMVKKLEKIKSLGVYICMDDFGIGCSSLPYLHKLPLDAIKIDKSFIQQITKNGDKDVIIDAIISMAKSLDVNFLVEGVEKEYQREYLIERGCLYYQGYLFSKPIQEKEYIKIIKKQEKWIKE